jgi:hypothetical protein
MLLVLQYFYNTFFGFPFLDVPWFRGMVLLLLLLFEVAVLV